MFRFALALSFISIAAASAGPAEEAAQRALALSGVKGGLVVHVGCGDGAVTAALRVDERYVVQGLAATAADLVAARRTVQQAGLSGPVSVVRWNGGALPYADNLVNLLVVTDPAVRVPAKEALRALAPLGVLVELTQKAPRVVRKPYPADMDEWTHWKHDAGGNAVAEDLRVGPPQRMQWVARPLSARGHELPSSVGALVTAKGRVFYVLDEGQPGVYAMPARWTLIARDAFNGVLLWKHPVPSWGEPTRTGGFGTGFRPLRLATDGDRVYLPLGEDAVPTAFEAATGELVKELQPGLGATEILCEDNRVLVMIPPIKDAQRRGLEGGDRTQLAVFRQDTLDLVWKKQTPGLAGRTTVADGGRICFRDREGVKALDAQTGDLLWALPIERQQTKGRGGGTTLVLSGDRLYFLEGSVLRAANAATGKLLWEQKNAGSSKGDLFLAGGLLWRDRGASIVGHDPATGEVQVTRDASGVFSLGHHPRCYPAKATDRFILTPNRGAEFISLTSNDHVQNDWVRGNCGYGVMPANGLLYAPPNQCFCYAGVMLQGFKALATGDPQPAREPTDPVRLEKGPAYGSPLSGQTSATDWPMYRHDPARLGAAAVAIPTETQPLWQTEIGGRLTQPVVADGRVLVAAPDAHTLYAFDATSGKAQWSFVAGGRIDSAPTVLAGRVLFGCADGWVYCLRAADGELNWRFLAAPSERQVGAFGQLESAWPVHGSVVPLGGLVYCTAGRSTYLDGGIYAYALNPATGAVVHHALLSGAARCPEQDDGEKPFVPAFHMEGARTDLLVTDGTSLFLGPLKLNRQLHREPTPYVQPPADSKLVALDLSEAPFADLQSFKTVLEKRRNLEFPALGVLRGPMGDKEMGLHLVTTGGFLDDTWFNRTFWMYAKVWPGFYINHLGAKSGQLLTIDETTTYGVQAFPGRTIHSPTFTPGTTGYLLFADANDNEPVLDSRTRNRDKGMGFTRTAPPKWHHWVPLRIRAMVATGDKLFVAGPPDVMDPDDPYAAFEDRRGAALWTFNKADGKKLAEAPLKSAPVFDGLCAAGDRLFLSDRAGRLTCLGAR